MRNRLFDNYTMCCGGGNVKMQTDITSESSDDEIRRYMFGKHNDNARQDVHKAVAYRTDDPAIAAATSVGLLNLLKNKGIVLPNKLDDYVVLHAGLPVDTMSMEELKRYDESSSVRESAA